MTVLMSSLISNSRVFSMNNLNLALIIIITMILSSCNNEKLVTSSLNIAYSYQDSSFREQRFSEIINSKDSYIFILLNGDCSACMFELSWWDSFLKTYNKLHPIFVVTTDNVGIFLIYAQETILTKYNFTFDKDRIFYIRNKLNNESYSIITDCKLNILYKGDPIKKNRFLKVYRKLK